MTGKQYKDHFVGMLKPANTGIEDLDEHVGRAIDAGLKAFWAASNWSFKEAEYDLTLSSTADAYDLPDDFDSFRTVREQETTQGRKLWFFPKERFDEMLPKLSAHSTGTPKVFTIYRDQNDMLWKISFYPRSGGSETIKIAYYQTTTTQPENVPDRAQSCLEAFIAWKCYPFHHVGRANAAIEAENETRKLLVIDKVDQSSLTHWPDGSADLGRADNIYGIPWLP